MCVVLARDCAWCAAPHLAPLRIRSFRTPEAKCDMSLMEIYKIFRNKRKLEPKRATKDCAASRGCYAHCVLQLGNLAVGGGAGDVDYALEPYGRQEQH